MTNHEKTPASTRTPRYTQPSNLPSARDNQGQPSHPTRGLFMASLTLSLAAALTACWSAAPEPITTVVTAISAAFQVTDVQAFNTGVNSQAATGATGSSTGISISFDQPVNRASIERSINIFDGEINPALNPKKITKLGLTSMCNGTWRVRNANTSPIAFTWDIRKDSEREDNDEHDDDDKHRKGLEQGTGMVPANADVMLQTSNGPHSLRLLVGGKNQQSKHATRTACTSSPMTFAWAADSKSVVASPKTALVLNKTYSVVVSTFAKNSSGSAALSVPFVSKVVVQENLSTSGTLVPGGSWTSKDGVRIVAPVGSISSPVTISVIKRNEPAESFGELANVFEPIAIYKVSSNPIGEVDSELLQLYFPVPNTANLDDYVLLQLGSSDSTTAPSFGSGVKSWKYVHRNYEKQAEILRKDVGFDFDFYMIARTSSIKTPKKALSINSVSVPSFVPDCSGVENCDNLSAQVQSILNTEYSILINQLGLDSTVLLNEIILEKTQINSFDKDCQNGAFAYYDYWIRKLQFCIDVEMNGTVINGKLRSGNYLSKTVRHELFHALQFEKIFRAGVRVRNPNSFTYLGQYPPNLDNRRYYMVGRNWIFEGAATAIEYSDLSKFNRQTRGYDEGIPDRDLFKSTSTLKENKSPVVLENDMYETQDFWVFSGQNTFRKSKWNLNYLLTIFSSGLKTAFPTQELDATFQTLGYPGGLKSAYWEWSKNQSYERFEDLENLNSAPCSANLSTTFPDFSKRVAQDGFRPPIYVEDLSKVLTYNFAGNSDQIKDKPFTVSSLTTEVISVNFLNAINTGVNVSFKSQGDFKYKIYRSDQPLSTPDACKGFSDAKEDNPVFPITPGTKLFILAANVDLVNSSSFTVTVEPASTKPVVKQLTPTGPQNVTDQHVYLQGFAGQTVNTTLVLTNEGAVGTSMEYTLQPIGNHVTSGVSVASVRNPVSTPTGTAQGDVWNSNLFQTRKGTLRAPNDPDVTHGSDKLEFSVSATCPEVGGLLRTHLELVYTTGLTDDFGTPDVFSDDKPALDLAAIPVVLVCNVNRLAGFGMTTRVLKNDGSIWDLGGITPQTGKYYRNWVTSYTPCIAESQSYVPRRISSFSDAVSFTGETAVRSDGSVWVSPMLRYQFDNIFWTRESRLDNAGKLVAIDYNTAIGKDGSVWVLAEDGSGYVKLDEIKNAFESRFPLILTRDGVVMSWTLTPQAMAQTEGMKRQSSQNPLNSNQVMPRFDSQPQSPRLKYLANLVQKYATSRKMLSSKSYPGNPDLNLKPISGLTNVRSIAIGGRFSYAVQDDGTVWTWETDASAPSVQRVSEIDNVVSVTASGRYYDGDSVLAIKKDGSVWGWGVDNYGQVSGDGIAKSGYPFFQREIPIQVPGITGATSVATTWDGGQSLALTKNGDVYQWGYDGTTCLNSINTLVTSPPTVVINAR
jgi:hypothetical protein